MLKMVKNKTYIKKDYDDYLNYERIKFKSNHLLSLPFKRVLDVGCASGLALHLLRKNNNNSDFLGIDIDKEMIDMAKNFFSSDLNSSFKLDEIETLQSSEDFDLILLWGLISFYNSYEDLIIKLKSLLAPNGYISIWSGFCNSEFDVRVTYSKDSEINSGLNMFSLPKLTNYLENNGFSVTCHRYIPKTPLSSDPKNPLVSYTVQDQEDLMIVNGLNVVRDFYHLILHRKI